jgi:molybdopterin-binding protein
VPPDPLGGMPPEGYHPDIPLSSDCNHRFPCLISPVRSPLSLDGVKYSRGRISRAYNMTSSNLLTPRQAAARIGISYPALKHWILAGRIRTVKTPGGHHRIPTEALEEFLPGFAAKPVATRISSRNQLHGSVVEVKIDGLLAKVVLEVGNQRVTAIITADAVRDLALKPGDDAVAIIKSTEVMIGRP